MTCTRRSPTPFPDYYGRNLNALNDCMRDVAHGDYGFDRHAPAGMIALDRFDEFVAREPRTAQRVGVGPASTAVEFGVQS